MQKSPTHLVLGGWDSATALCPGRASLLLPAANCVLCPLSEGYCTLRCIPLPFSPSPPEELRARPCPSRLEGVQGVAIRATARAHHKDDSLRESDMGFTSFRFRLAMSLNGRQPPGFHRGRPVRWATARCVNTKHMVSAPAVSFSASADIQFLKFTQRQVPGQKGITQPRP